VTTTNSRGAEIDLVHAHNHTLVCGDAQDLELRLRDAVDKKRLNKKQMPPAPSDATPNVARARALPERGRRFNLERSNTTPNACGLEVPR
jgi:hypothetical protein